MVNVEIKVVFSLLRLHEKCIFVNTQCVNILSQLAGLLTWQTVPWQIIYYNQLLALL